MNETASNSEHLKARRYYIQRSHLSPFSPDYLQIQNDRKAITSLIGPDTFLYFTAEPIDIEGSQENYGLSQFQVTKLKKEFPGNKLYSYRITLEIPCEVLSSLTFVRPHQLSTRVSGSEIVVGEFNGVFIPDEVIAQLKATIYVAEVGDDDSLGEFKKVI